MFLLKIVVHTIWILLKNHIFALAFERTNFYIMNAIVEIAGQQYNVEQGQEFHVHQLKAEEGDKVTFDKVLLVHSDAGTQVGKPTVSAAKVEATVIRHEKGDKVIVFKKKRRKGYKVKNGHRQCFTRIKIDSIIA